MADVSPGRAAPRGELLLSLAVPLVIIVYMLKFSKSCPDRVTQAAS
jgi:hypothetical protein